jgi:hypothetical protein
MLVITTISKMPLSAHPAREILKNYLPLNSAELTGFIYLFTFLIFLVSGNLANCISLVGACGSLSTSFIFPGFLLQKRAALDPPLIPGNAVKLAEIYILNFLAFSAAIFAISRRRGFGTPKTRTLAKNLRGRQRTEPPSDK